MAETFLQRQQRIRGRAGAQPGVDGQYRPQQQPATQQPSAAPAPAPRPAAQPVQAQPAPAYSQPAQASGPTAASGANRPAPTYNPVASAPGAVTAPTSYTPQPATASASAPAAAPTAPSNATYTPGQFSQWQTARYGRAANPAELQKIAAAVGAPQGPNGTYTQAQYEQGQQISDQLARAQGWNGPALAAPGAGAFGPNSGVDPNVAGNVGHLGRAPVDPGPGYQAGQLGAFQGPNTGNVGQLNTSLMESILANPESLPPSVIAQMKAGGKASAAKQAQQLRGQAATNLAGRGFSGGGGMQAAADAAVDQNFLTELLNSNRNVDIQAATQNFQDRLNASGAGTQFQNAASQRAIGEYGAQAQGFGLNEGARQAQSQDQLSRAGFTAGQMQNDRSSNLQEWLARQGVNLDNSKFTEAKNQFKQTFGLDLAQFLENTRQYNQNFGEGSRQFNVGAGLNTAQLQQRANDSMLAWLQAGGL